MAGDAAGTIERTHQSAGKPRIGEFRTVAAPIRRLLAAFDEL
jgi:hypothetical protein